MKSDARIPLVYSCSGCSDAAQLANHLAVRLDRTGLAEMSRIADIGGRVNSTWVRRGRASMSVDLPTPCLAACLLACGPIPPDMAVSPSSTSASMRWVFVNTMTPILESIRQSGGMRICRHRSVRGQARVRQCSIDRNLWA